MTAAQQAQHTCSRCGCSGLLHREDEVERGCQLAELRTALLFYARTALYMPLNLHLLADRDKGDMGKMARKALRVWECQGCGELVPDDEECQSPCCRRR